MAAQDFSEAITVLEQEALASPAPHLARMAREITVALRDAMDAEQRMTALSALALAGPEVVSTILRRHGRADLAATLEGPCGSEVVMTLRRVAPPRVGCRATQDHAFVAKQQAQAEHDAARQAEVREAVDALLQTLEPRDTRDLPTYIILTGEDAQRLCDRLVDVRPDTVLTTALNWLLRQARHWVRPPAVPGDTPRRIPWFVEQAVRIKHVAEELSTLVREAGW
jgi:hypothetical protein